MDFSILTSDCHPSHPYLIRFRDLKWSRTLLAPAAETTHHDHPTANTYFIICSYLNFGNELFNKNRSFVLIFEYALVYN